MFRQINRLRIVTRSLTNGSQRILSVEPFRWNSGSSPQNEPSEEGCSPESEKQNNANGKKLNRREALWNVMKEIRSGSIELRQCLPLVSQPSYRGPEVKKMPEVQAPPKEGMTLKMSRRDYLRQMSKESLMKPKEKEPIDDVQMISTKFNKNSLDPSRVEFMNQKWKERQEEIKKRKQEAGKDKYVTRFEMNAGRKEKIK